MKAGDKSALWHDGASIVAVAFRIRKGIGQNLLDRVEIAVRQICHCDILQLVGGDAAIEPAPGAAGNVARGFAEDAQPVGAIDRVEHVAPLCKPLREFAQIGHALIPLSQSDCGKLSQ